MDWGDYDNDGFVDMIIIGQDDKGTASSTLFHSAVTRCMKTNNLLPGLPPLFNGDVSWGDYDHDGWLDLGCNGHG